LYDEVPECTIAYAENLTVEEILKLAQRQHTLVLKCNEQIKAYNKKNKENANGKP
jgi:hypothetical protein